MKNRAVGVIILGIALVISYIIFSFNRALSKIVETSCTHGTACPMWGTISFQTHVGIGIMVVVVMIGLYLIFFGKDERIEIKTITQQIAQKDVTIDNYKNILEKLNNDEKVILEKVIEAKGTIFQSDIVDKTSFTKVKVTRVLDKLEGMDIIERKRRGMTNVVILKH
ncbi:hypothetical protein J4434_00520 [Candidatus Woesearchaeota archaeon]|nr:hypothetical protein [Candidatus Woesearchaeota archaeon]